MSSKKVLVSQREVDPEIRAGDVALVGSGIDVCEAGDTLTIGASAVAVSFPVPVNFASTVTQGTVVDMADRVIHLGATTGNVAVPTQIIGIAADRGQAAGVKRDMASLVWDEANSRWLFALITQGDDATLGAAQVVHAGSFLAPTLGRATAGALALGGSATSIVVGAPMTFEATQRGVVKSRTLEFGHADLTAAALSEALNLDAALPAGAMIVGVPSVAVSAAFTDGAGATVTLDIGTAGDPNAIGTWDLDAAPVDGQAGAYTPGIAPGRLYAGATQLLATVTSGVNVDTLTAGAAVVTVLFVVP